MKEEYGFRSVAEWKAALTALPDQNFFELLRIVFGNVKTPFNKQRLMDDLYALLSQEDIRKTIAAYIDERDRLVIAAVGLLDSPAHGELENFLSGHLQRGELHTLICNLEERMILFRFKDGEKRRMALNPVLQNILAPLAAETEQLFPSSPLKADTGKTGVVTGPVFSTDNRIMALFFTYIEHEKNFFKAGGIRKKIQNDRKRLFPDLEPELAVPVLEQLGLFRHEEESFVPDKRRIGDFGALGQRERRVYWAAALYLHLYGKVSSVKAISAWESFNYARLKEAAFLMSSLIDFMDPLLCYPKITLRRYACLLDRYYSAKDPWGRRLFGDSPESRIEPYLETMEKCGLIAVEDEFISIVSIARSKKDTENENVIAMDSTFSFILYPDISLADALSLAAFCSLKEDGGFELTRSSVIHFFDQGSTSDELVETLKRLSGDRLDGSLEFTLKDWEARYTSVSLYRGEVLVLAEDRRYLADARPLSSLIKKTLAPGVYLLRSDDRHEVTRALQRAGVDIFSQSDAQSGESKTGRFQANSFPSMGKNAVLPAFFAAGTDSSPKERKDSPAKSRAKRNDVPAENTVSPAAALKLRFSERLKEMRVSDMEREELNARIERRLVLTEAQLETRSLKYERLEARGLDYNGKAALARQAIGAGSLVEASWPKPGGEIGTITGIPTAMENQGAEVILIIQSKDAEGGKMRLPLRKISRLRRIKQSIFEG